MTDDAIDTTDVPPLGESFFAKAALRAPENSIPVTVHVDSDVLAWFQSQGEQCEPRMSAALRIYVEAHRQ
jgi:uncharacterized protein (DUF4415 family)